MNSQKNRSLKLSKHLYVVEEGQLPGQVIPTEAVTAEVGKQIRFNETVLNTFDVKGCTSLHYDLLLVCAAIEFADRRWKRPQRWGRIFHVTIPVSNLKIWQKSEVVASIHSVLQHLTGDQWQFNFIQAVSASPIGSQQIPMAFGSIQKTFVVAYSNGLDSRAVTALSGNKEQALCIRVAAHIQHRQNGESYFTRIPFQVSGFRGSESSFRSRGFQFATITAIAAHLTNIRRIVVPESGQGALGPVLLPLHNVHPDYRNHPTFFRKMERFIQSLLNFQVTFEQPRLWSTKGQTIGAFLSISEKSELQIRSTRSCWQTRGIVNKGSRKQCGLCAACLLRRLSLHAAGIEEARDTYIVADLNASDASDALSVISRESDRNIMIEYGSVGVRHLQQLAEMARMPDSDLRVHAAQIAGATEKTYEETLTNLRKMLIAHAEEWRAFLFEQGEHSYIKTWMDGGRDV